MPRGRDHPHVDHPAGGIEVELQSDVTFAPLGQRLIRVDCLAMGLERGRRKRGRRFK